MRRNEGLPLSYLGPTETAWRREERVFNDEEQERELRKEIAREEKITQEERARRKDARAQKSLDKYNNMYRYQRMVPVSALDPEERGDGMRPPMLQYGSVYKRLDTKDINLVSNPGVFFNNNRNIHKHEHRPAIDFYDQEQGGRRERQQGKSRLL